MSEDWKEEVTSVAGTDLAFIKGGTGRPLLVLHEELGHPGWLNWHSALAANHSLIIPVQPGLGRSARLDWIRSVHDLGCFYARVLREMKLVPIDIIGFSIGGWIAAEMMACNSAQFRRVVMVAPAGIRPPEGEILDIFTITGRRQLSLSVYNRAATPEFGKLYGGERSPAQFEAFEEARAENARLAWEPHMHNPALPHLLEGVAGLPIQIVWGTEDVVIPSSAAEAYRKALRNTDVSVTIFERCGHRPEIEQPAEFTKLVRSFLGQPCPTA